MHTDLPKTINEALKILAYNDYFWTDPQKAHIKPHPKDQETVKISSRSTIRMDREARTISTCYPKKVPDQVPSTRNGYKIIVGLSNLRRRI